MKPLRVLFFSSWYPNEENPGLGIFIQRHAEVLAADGAEVMVVSFGTVSGETIEIKYQPEIVKGLKEVSLLIPIRDKSKIGKLQWLIRDRKILKQFFGQIQSEFNPEILQVNVAFPAGFFWWINRELLPKKIILAEHWSGYLPEDGRYKGVFQQLITGSLVYHSSAVLVVSEALKNAMIQQGLNGNFLPLPNVVDGNIFSCKRRSINDNFVFIHVSSLDKEEKNPELLLSAFSVLLKAHPHTRLIMVGGPKDRIELLKKMAGNLNISDNIRWEGIRSPKEVANLISEAHVFVLSSKFEGQPVVLLEAMSSGIPVVAPMVGGIPQMVSRNEGVLYAPGNESELIKAMTEIIIDYKRFDGESISAGIQEKHGKEAVAKYLKSVYSKVIGNA